MRRSLVQPPEWHKALRQHIYRHLIDPLRIRKRDRVKGKGIILLFIDRAKDRGIILLFILYM